MDDKFLVFNKETIEKVLTRQEGRDLESFSRKIRKFEGNKTYVVSEEGLSNKKGNQIVDTKTSPYTFKLIRKVTPNNALAIEYTFEYEGDKLFFERCIDIAERYNYEIKFVQDYNLLNFLQPKDVRHHFVTIHRSVLSDNPYRKYFSTFLKGEGIYFEESEKALIFEKLAFKVIKNWLSIQWIEFLKIQSIESSKENPLIQE